MMSSLVNDERNNNYDNNTRWKDWVAVFPSTTETGPFVLERYNE